MSHVGWVDSVLPREATPLAPGSAFGTGGNDAVIVIPNIFGSELVDDAGELLWGTSSVRWYINAWGSGRYLEKLALTAGELAGETGRVRPSGLLRSPAFVPGLAGIEPYSPLVRRLEQLCPNPAAVHQFAYDWRLPVAHNAVLLAEAAVRHLRQWQSHPSGNRTARLILVAHGAGGLIAKYFTGLMGGAGRTRLTIGIGVPHQGSAAVVELLQGRRSACRSRPRGRDDCSPAYPGSTICCPRTGASKTRMTCGGSSFPISRFSERTPTWRRPQWPCSGS